MNRMNSIRKTVFGSAFLLAVTGIWPPMAARAEEGAGSSPVDAVTTLRRSLRYGLADESHRALVNCRTHFKNGSLSNLCEGQLIFYEALCEVLAGKRRKSAELLSDAFAVGIVGVVDEEVFRKEIDPWRRLLAGKGSSPPIRLSSNERTVFHFALQSEANPVAVVNGIVDEIRDSKAKLASGDTSILNDIRLATWELLLGEYTAIHPEISLPTTAIDALLEGRDRLAKIELRIEETPGLEDKISADPQLAIRLDTVRVRTVAFRSREKTARAEEVNRLGQLRELARKYRDLSAALTRWHASYGTGDVASSKKDCLEAFDDLGHVYKVVNSRHEMHLFDDEPAVSGDSEFAVVETKPLPFSENTLSHFKALQALSFLKGAERADDFEDDLVRDAEVWAHAALQDSDGPLAVPSGADPSNVLAKWVLSLTNEMKGEQFALSADAEERRKSEQHFVKAHSLLSDIVATFEGRGDDSTLKLLADAKDHLQALDSPVGFVTEAHRLASIGQPRTARELLLSALRRHPKEEIGIEWLRFGLRLGNLPNDLESEWRLLLQANVIKNDSPIPQIVLAEIRNRAAGDALLRHADDANECRKATDLINESISRLQNYCDDRTLPPKILASAKSAYALAVAQKELLGSERVDAAVVEAAFRHARDAELSLTRLLQNEGRAPEGHEDSIVLREALISSRLAAGHLAALHLEDWQTDSEVFFIAAADTASQLKQAVPFLSLVGRPLLTQVFGHSDGDAAELAAVEKQRRYMITRCLEAIFTADFGSAEAGALAMEKAAELARGAMDGEDAVQELDPNRLSETADGFDSKVTLPQTVRALAVLTNIQAGRSKRALQAALELALGGSERGFEADHITKKQVSECLRSVQSPLVAFSLGRSLEAYVQTIPIHARIDYRMLLVEAAKESYSLGARLLQAERLSAKYPHFGDLLTKSLQRLESPQLAIGTIKNELKNQRFASAAKVASEALSNHPDDASLWSYYFIAMFNKKGSEQNEAEAVLEELQAAHEAGLLADNGYHLLRGDLHERQGRLTEALEEYRQAVDSAENKLEKIKSLAQTARVRAAVARDAHHGF